jgi:hypothetical protein
LGQENVASVASSMVSSLYSIVDMWVTYQSVVWPHTSLFEWSLCVCSASVVLIWVSLTSTSNFHFCSLPEVMPCTDDIVGWTKRKCSWLLGAAVQLNLNVPNKDCNWVI